MEDVRDFGDFKIYYDTKLKINIWVLVSNDSGSIHVKAAYKAGKKYAKATNVSLGTVQIGEIVKSPYFKGFKYLFSEQEQSPAPDAVCMEDVFGYLLY